MKAEISQPQMSNSLNVHQKQQEFMKENQISSDESLLDEQIEVLAEQEIEETHQKY